MTTTNKEVEHSKVFLHHDSCNLPENAHPGATRAMKQQIIKHRSVSMSSFSLQLPRADPDANEADLQV